MKLAKQISSTLAICLIGAAFGSLAQAQDEQAMRMHKALMSPDRSADNKARDELRKPVETVQFVGIKTGQTVIDMFAFGGWFTEVLSAAVGPTGKVYSQNPDFITKREGFMDTEKALADRLGNVTPVHGELAAAGVTGADAAITALNLHDVYGQGGEAAAVGFLKGIYDALKPGGVLGVIDHAGMADHDNKAMHRIPVQTARDLLAKAGFTVEAESSILAYAGDDHMKPVFQLQHHTDQFLIRARKPK